MDTSRVLVYDHLDAPLFELAPGDVWSRDRKEVLNGERSLEITTSVVLEKEQRVLTCDATGKWREWVVTGCDAEHAAGRRAFGTYYCDWSLKHDLTGTVVNRMPGTQTPVTAAVALEAALSGTSRWAVGTVTRTATGGASMYYVSGWEALAIVTRTWGGEVDAQIAVDADGVISRSVALYEMLGNQSATRRFDYGRDLSAISRKVSEEAVYCRIVPRGKGEDLGNGSFGRRITIESVNGGRNYIENPAAAADFRLPDGSGGYEYPTCLAVNEDIETPAELLAWGNSVLDDYTVPKVTYEASVTQLAQAGMDVTGLALGDAVQCVDRLFGDEPLRVSGRVVQLDVNELKAGDVRVTIGYLTAGLAGMASALSGRIDQVQATLEAVNGGTMSTADYLARLLDRINAEINATGGYWYMIPGMGTRTYDVAVSDPAVGAEASRVVEVRGGTIRIADSRTSAGEWEWRTVFTSGHIAAELVTAVNVTAGFIGSADSGNFIDLDNGEWRLAAVTAAQQTADHAASVAGTLSTQAGALAALTNDGAAQGIYLSNGQLYINGEFIKANTISTNVITTADRQSYTTVNASVSGFPGMACYGGGKNYLDVVTLSEGTASDTYVGGVGMRTLGMPFLRATNIQTSEGMAPGVGSLYLWAPDYERSRFYPSDHEVGIEMHSQNGVVVAAPGGNVQATQYASSLNHGGRQVAVNDTSATVSYSSTRRLSLGANAVGLYHDDSCRLWLGSDSAILYFDATHYVRVDSGGVQCRCGSKGFGWSNGQFYSDLTWS